MNPEMLHVCVAAIGWPLAITRLVAILAISLSAGYATAYLDRRDFIGATITRTYHSQRVESLFGILPRRLRRPGIEVVAAPGTSFQVTVANTPSAGAEALRWRRPHERYLGNGTVRVSLCSGACRKIYFPRFFFEVVIIRYILQETIVSFLGGESILAPLWATVTGIPLYTTTVASLGLIGGLLDRGMSKDAALAFLIASPTTTIPATATVYHVVNMRLFAIYIGFPTLGALIIGFGRKTLA